MAAIKEDSSELLPETDALNDSSALDGEHVPGEVGIWVFVLGDLLVFTLFFLVFLVYRSADVELYRESKMQLNVHLGALNTVLLLLSSWSLATSVAALRSGQEALCKNTLSFTVLCGIGFVVVKYFEYSEKVGAGFTLLSNDFFMYYFVFTGIHLLHLLIGLVVLAYLWLCLRRGGLGRVSTMTMESGATYWHMVDLLWVVLFPLLYLLP